MDIGIQKCIPRYIQISKFSTFNASVTKMKQSNVFDRLSLIQVIGVWITGIVLFGAIYFGLIFINQPLTYHNEPLTKNVNGLGNSLYFSFITAMTIGYNDITPSGYSKLAVILEAIFSVALFGLFIAKIVAVKQEELVQEVEELSFEESTNSAISEMYIFRNDIKNINEQITSSKKIGNEVKNFEQSLSTLKLALQNIDHATNKLTTEQKQNSSLRIELILNSINFSLSRMVEMLEAFNHRKADWKKESITAAIAECAKTTQKLYEEYSFLKSGTQGTKVAEKLEDLNKTLKNLQETLS
jgi:hypothetical protein